MQNLAYAAFLARVLARALATILTKTQPHERNTDYARFPSRDKVLGRPALAIP